MDQITVLMVSAGVDSTNQGLKMFGEKKIIPESYKEQNLNLPLLPNIYMGFTLYSQLLT